MSDEFKDVFELSAEAIPESQIRWWSRYARRMRFKTEAEAREWVHHKLELWDTEVSATVFGPQGPAKNRWFADNVPVYQDRWGTWRVGRPLLYYRRRELPGDAEERERQKQVRAILQQHKYDYLRQFHREHGGLQEYLSNNTSDFSDGTNGEPSAPASFAGDGGTNVGLPDYKYLERKKARHDKLKALMKRRDPSQISRVAWDRKARAGLGESEETDDMKELAMGYPQLTQQEHSPDYFLVDSPEGYFIGVVYKEQLGEKPSIPSLRALYLEYPWIAQPSGVVGQAGRFKSKEDGLRFLWDRHLGTQRPYYGPDYWKRSEELRNQHREADIAWGHAQAQRNESVLSKV